MKIGIIIHSKTGNTYSVAQNLKDRLEKTGHSVRIEKVEAENDDQTDISRINLKEVPDISSYDGLIFGGPVRGFSLSPVLTAFLSQISPLNAKKTFGYITHSFPFPWMGGTRSIGQLIGVLKSKDANIIGTGIVSWSSKNRLNKINSIIEDAIKLF